MKINSENVREPWIKGRNEWNTNDKQYGLNASKQAWIKYISAEWEKNHERERQRGRCRIGVYIWMVTKYQRQMFDGLDGIKIFLFECATVGYMPMSIVCCKRCSLSLSFSTLVLNACMWNISRFLFQSCLCLHFSESNRKMSIEATVTTIESNADNKRI